MNDEEMKHIVDPPIAWSPDVPTSDSTYATLVELLRWRAYNQPDRLAYRFLADGDGSVSEVTYDFLNHQAAAIAARLTKNWTPGERALLLFPSGIDYIIAFLSCLYSGMLAVPLFLRRMRRSTSWLQAIAGDALPSVALTTRAILSNLSESSELTPELSSLEWIAIDDPTIAPLIDWQPPVIPSESPAFLQYTSGSTGTPRGVVVTHRNLMHNLGQIYRCFGHTPESSVVSWLPPYHDMGLIGAILQPLYGGFPLTFMSPVSFLQRPVRWLEAISRYRATTSGGPNFAYELCCNKITAEQRVQLDLSSWSVAFNGAEPIRHDTLERFAETFASCGFSSNAWYPCYGLGEATLFVSGGPTGRLPKRHVVNRTALEEGNVVAARPEDRGAQVLISSGPPVPEQRVVIVDPETRLPSPEHRVGEIWVAGPSVAAGYWNQTSSTEEIFSARRADTCEGPFLRTGDLGFFKDGELFIVGRIKDLIIIRGSNHYPQDIERTVEASHPALQSGAGAAFSIDLEGEERLVVVQELPRHWQSLDVDNIIEAIRAAVSDIHNLRVHIVSLLKFRTIPKTSSGKVQRFACRSRLLDGTLSTWGTPIQWSRRSEPRPPVSETKEEVVALGAVETVANRDEIQAWLLSHLATTLGVSPHEIEVSQPLVYYGLDSVRAVQLTGELEVLIGRKLPPTLAYEYPTIEAIVRYLMDESDMKPASDVTEERRMREHIAIIDSRRATLQIKTDQAERLLAELDQLSDEGVDSLLRRLIMRRQDE